MYSASHKQAPYKTMTMMHTSLVAAVALHLVCLALESSGSLPEYNPELGAYQNESNCFPLQDTWYIMYRNFKEDQFFGGDAKCVLIWEDGPFVDNSATFKAEFETTTESARAILMSSPGYAVKNVIHAESLYVPEVGFNLTSVYTDCQRCKVFRHSYIENGTGCSLWQPKHAIGEDISCCKFLFDLVCGTSQKYQVYDNC